jgi:hypothetical protein
MPFAPLTKVKATSAAKVCKNFALKEEARPLLSESQTPADFLETLLANKRYAAAIDFLAHALPPREAIWWGCLCLQQVSGSRLPPVEAAAFKAAVQWVLEPTEEHRRTAQPPGEAAGLGTCAGGLAMATTWTGGSLAPPNPDPQAPPIPPVPPGPFIPAQVIAGAILLAAVKGEPTRIADTQRLFLELGIGVAEGRFVWPEVKPPPKAPGLQGPEGVGYAATGGAPH